MAAASTAPMPRAWRPIVSLSRPPHFPYKTPRDRPCFTFSHLPSTVSQSISQCTTSQRSLISITFSSSISNSVAMSDTQELNARAAAGETVVPGGTGGKSLEAQQHLAKGRSKGGQTRAEQLGHEGYAEMGKKGGSATNDMSGGEAADAAGRDIDESKFTT